MVDMKNPSLVGSLHRKWVAEIILFLFIKNEKRRNAAIIHEIAALTFVGFYLLFIPPCILFCGIPPCCIPPMPPIIWLVMASVCVPFT